MHIYREIYSVSQKGRLHFKNEKQSKGKLQKCTVSCILLWKNSNISVLYKFKFRYEIHPYVELQVSGDWSFIACISLLLNEGVDSNLMAQTDQK